jgi:ParB family chromosome partitioning protein
MNIRTEIALPGIWHEYANLFPMLHGEALDGLREDIRQHGVREPIITFQGKILDGRNRYLCARDLGQVFPVLDFTGDDAEALAYVVSTNLHRRHLSESQRASVAAKLANMPLGGATYRSANLPTDSETGPSLSEQAAARPPMTSTADAARMLNVSERSVTTARKVLDTAPAEIVQAVDDGRMSVSLAAKVADLPEATRAEIIAAPPEEVREVAREAVKKAHVAQNSGNNEWYTPAAFVDAARDVLGGFDLDPASSEIANRTVRAERIFTAEDDGLAQDWPIGTIWMNPPYAQPLMGQFADRFAAEVRRGSTGIVLVNNATETAWFQTIAAECAAICFPRTRIKFVDPEGNASGAPLQGQAIIYCGPSPDDFAEAFSAFGLVVLHGKV